MSAQDPFTAVLTALVEAVQGHSVNLEELRATIRTGRAERDAERWLAVIDLIARDDLGGAETALRFVARGR